MMIKKFCDRCSREYTIGATLTIPRTSAFYPESPTEDSYDLCATCLAEIRKEIQEKKDAHSSVH